MSTRPHRLEKIILRLVGGADASTYDTAQVDAVIHPANGEALLLPAAQRSLVAHYLDLRRRFDEREAERRVSLDDLAIAVAVLDAGGTVLSTNAAWRAAAAHQPSGVRAPPGANYLAILEHTGALDPVGGPALAAGIRRVISGACKVFECDYCEYADDEPDGRRWVAATVSATRGRVLGVVVSRSNITARVRERRLLEDGHAASIQALRRSETRYRKLTEIAADWYWEQDRELRFTRCTGWSLRGADAVVGKTLWELPEVLLDEVSATAHRARLAARWAFFDLEFSAVRPDGEVIHYCMSGEPLYDEDGVFAGYCGTGQDITRRAWAGRLPSPGEMPA